MTLLRPARSRFEGFQYDSTRPIDEGFFILQGDVDGNGFVDFQLGVLSGGASIVIVNPDTDFIL